MMRYGPAVRRPRSISPRRADVGSAPTMRPCDHAAERVLSGIPEDSHVVVGDGGPTQWDDETAIPLLKLVADERLNAERRAV